MVLGRCGAGVVQPTCSMGTMQCGAVQGQCSVVQVQSHAVLGRGGQPPPAHRHSRLRKALTWLMSSRSSLLELSTRALVWFALSRAACARSRASSAFPLASATWAGQRPSTPAPRAGGHSCATCSHQHPCATHPVGKLGHIASSPPQLLLGMACPVQRAVSCGHGPTAAQTPAAPCPIFVPAPSSPAGALSTGHIARCTAHLQDSTGSGQLWGPSP